MDLIWAFHKLHEQDGTNMKKHPNEIMLEKIERYNNPPKKTENEIAYEELMKKVKEKNDEKKRETK